MRKLLFNVGVISAIFGTVGIIRSTRRGPRDWRLVLRWISWACGTAIAIGAVIEQNRQAEQEELEQ